MRDNAVANLRRKELNMSITSEDSIYVKKESTTDGGSRQVEQIVIFPSQFNDNLYMGKRPQLSDKKMTIDCLQCQHVWFCKEKGYYCDLQNDECSFEEI